MEVIITNETDMQMADRSTRFFGAIIDGFSTLIGMLILEVIFGDISAIFNANQSMETTLRFAGFGLVAFIAIHGYFIVTRGQSLGKIMLDMKIVDAAGNIPDWMKVLGIRHIVVMMLANIPIVGGLFSLADVLFIFRSDKRCLHDLMAGTFVINVGKASELKAEA